MSVSAEELYPGTQIIYQCVPEMEEEHGFVVNIARVGYVHCRFWKPQMNELRTLANSELVPISHLTIQNTRSQHFVNKTLEQLGYKTHVSEYYDRISPMLEDSSAIIHNQWSKWMSHVFRKGVINDAGDYVFPKELIEAWQKQIDTPYSELSVYEKDMDRRQVLELIDNVLFAHLLIPGE